MFSRLVRETPKESSERSNGETELHLLKITERMHDSSTRAEVVSVLFYSVLYVT